MRFLLILSIFLLIGCEKDELPVESRPQLAGDVAISDGERIKIGNFYGQPTLEFYDSNNNLIGRILGGPTYVSFDTNDGRYEAVISPEVIRVGVFAGNAIMLRASSTKRYLQIDGNQVIGARQPAIADATSPEDAVRAINELLAAYREHGSIARGEQIALTN